MLLKNEKFNIIADIEGRFKTLTALLSQMPKEATPLGVGDPNDRGPSSNLVIEFFKNNGLLLQSNHSHLMVDAIKQSKGENKFRFYEKGLWITHNGGYKTLESYDPKWAEKLNFLTDSVFVSFDESKLHELIDVSHFLYLKDLPMFYESEQFVISHAPIHSRRQRKDWDKIGTGFYEKFDNTSDVSLIWNRSVPRKPHKDLGSKINIFGHNSSDAVKIFTTSYPQGLKVDPKRFSDYWLNEHLKYPIFAICLDSGKSGKLSGLNLETMQLFQQDFED